jgi:taurine dioxygenase
MSAQIRPLSYALSAEVTGIDIRQPLSSQSVRAIQDAYLKYEVLLFRGQPLTEAQQVAFTRNFGQVSQNEGILRNRVPGYPEILRARPKPDPNAKINDFEFAGGMKKYAGNDWHSDRCFRLAPSNASLLRAVEIPPIGGDTMFACMYRAYETLSEGMKKLIDPLYAVHPGSENQIDHSSPRRRRRRKRRRFFP